MNFNLIKPYIKPITYTVVGLIVLYGVIYLFTRKPQMPAEYKAAIDSLNKVNAILIEKQNQLDSTIRVYESEVKAIDTKISSIKEKTTVIKEYYHEISQQTSHYNAAQVDSFFKSKYGY
jgi:uncharacterized protein YdcH (DUF465 family)